MARQALTAQYGAIWIQPSGANNPTYYLDCKDLGDLTISEGAKTLLQCFDASGVGWETVGSTVAPPDPVAFDITGLMYESMDWLEQVACPFTIYVLKRTCGRADIFGNYVRGFVISNVSRSQRTYSGLAARDTDVESTLAVALEAYPPVLQVEELEVIIKTTTATNPLNDIAFNVDIRCLGQGCGDELDAGQRGWIAGDSAVAPAFPDLLQTINDGDTWTQIADATPIGAGTLAGSVVRFPYGRTGERYIVGGNDVGPQGQVAYSDDNGATTTVVTIGGAATGEGPGFPGAMFALDQNHIWTVGSVGGEIYFSDDGGETWTQQEDGTLIGGVGYAIHFESTGQYGMAVGAAGTIAVSSDGGASWAAATAVPAGGDDFLCVTVLDENRAWIGTDESGLYFTRDFAATWTQRTGWTDSGLATGHVQDMSWVGDQVCFMSYQTDVPVGHVHYTFDGGTSWERLTTPANNGLNGIFAIDETHAFAVGVLAGAGFIVEVQPS